MRNFPTHFWKRFQDAKDNVAFLSPSQDRQPASETYWEWTRRVQRLAMGLMESGFEPGTRIGLVAPNSQAWLDVAFAAWLVGGCVVPLPADRGRRETLRCLARSGCDWIVTRDDAARLELRGQATSLPAELRWLVLEGAASGQNVLSLERLGEVGRDRLRRGGLNALAERTYGLDPKQPTLIVFEPEPGDDPQGAYFSGAKLAIMLEYLQRDLALADESVLAVVLGYGWFPAVLFTAAALLSGRTVATAPSLSELRQSFAQLRPTHLVCGPAFLHGQASRWLERLEQAPEFLRRLADPLAGAADGESGAPLARVLGVLGERAAQKIFYEPMVAEFGGRLSRIYVAGADVPPEVLDILDSADIETLCFFGVPESGISHMERAGARRRGTVGRPVEGFACKIDGARAEEPGEVLVRSDVLFDGYWAGSGPRHIDAKGWLHTGIRGRIVNGYLTIEKE